MTANPGRRGLSFLHPDFQGSERKVGLRLEPDGRLKTGGIEASVAESLLLLLTTAPGERLMRPAYGCALERLLFAPNDATTAGEAIHLVRQAIARFEPRAKILAIDAGPAEEDPKILLSQLHYEVRETGRAQTLQLELALGGDR